MYIFNHHFSVKDFYRVQLDSMQFLNCIVNIEKTFKIKIKEKEIKISNFKDINSIKKLINEKTK